VQRKATNETLAEMDAAMPGRLDLFDATRRLEDMVEDDDDQGLPEQRNHA
jgi:hypothetical protein